MRALPLALLTLALLPGAAAARPASAPVGDPSVVDDRHLAFKLPGRRDWTQSRGEPADTPSLGTYERYFREEKVCGTYFEFSGRVVSRKPRQRGDTVFLSGSAKLRVHRSGRHAGFTWWTGDRADHYAAIGAVARNGDGRWLVVQGGLIAAGGPPATKSCVRRIKAIAGPAVRTAAATLRLAQGPVVVRDDDR